MTGETLASWIGPAVASGAIAGVIAYITAVRTLETKTAVLEEREDNHYQELSRKCDNVLSEVRSLANEMRRRP